MVIRNREMIEGNGKELEKLKDHPKRLGDAETQIELLKKMGGASGDGGAGLIDVLNEQMEKLRKEMKEGDENVLKRLIKLEVNEKNVDEDQQK